MPVISERCPFTARSNAECQTITTPARPGGDRLFPQPDGHHLAELNIATSIADLDDPVMAGFERAGRGECHCRKIGRVCLVPEG